ncbi:MAG TPA: glycosyltransferase family 4 protein [Bryobacteraceae bacterium]|nr:glycosyltransferase family 4 protein [Bryobacteraceae bacterium]
MRILIATAHRNLVGGVEKYLQAICPRLQERGHILGLLHEYEVTPGRETIDPAQGFARIWLPAKADTKSILRAIAEWRPDIIYYHGFDRTESLALEDALLSAYPVALYVHNYDRTCGTGQKCYMSPQPKICDRQIGPMCLLLHYPRRCGGLHPGVMWRRYRRHVALNARLPQFKAVLVGSAHMHRELENSGERSGQVHLLPLPAADEPMQSPPDSRSTTGQILYVGRLTRLKGVDYVIRAIPAAAKELGRKLSVVVAGDGPERQTLGVLADRLGVAVDFKGWVETGTKLDLMRQAELLAVPSLWPEPFGLVGLEAGGVGLPAVGFATGGIPDWLIPRETGELAPSPPTVQGLTEAIVRALASAEHYRRLCTGAWNLTRKFSVNRHVDQLETLLGSLCLRQSDIQSGPVVAGEAICDGDAVSR